MSGRRRTPRAAAPAGRPRAERVHSYARDVVAGRVVAGRLVRLACERHLADLETGRERGLVWRAERAESILLFAEEVIFLDEGMPLRLADFQVFILGSLFGWYKADGFRRFRYAYIEIGKGNGKTPLAAVIGLYGLVMDKESSPEVYSAAVSADQAAICFRDAVAMVENSPELKGRVEVQVGSLSVPKRYGVFRALSSEHRNLDGKRVHIGIIDELHAHPDDKVSAKIRAGTKRRQNALILEITNSGAGQASVCWRHHDASVKILAGLAPNDSWFAYVCGLDPCPKCLQAGKDRPDPTCPDCDDWRNPATWPKANPGLGTILPVSYLEEQVGVAKSIHSEQNLVMRLNFCLWTEQAVRWINMHKWDECGRLPIDWDALRGRPCKIGLDASTVGDFSAVVLMWRLSDGRYAVKPRLFLPKDNLAARVESTGLRFDLWAEQGHISLTPGNQIDYGYIEQTIERAGQDYLVEEVAFDPWNITDLVGRLQGKGFRVVPVRQGYATLSPPSKEFEKDVLACRLLHGGHPVLRWMASNATTTSDPAGNIKPDKEKSGDKIDGIVAAIMARDRWLRAEPAAPADPWGAFV